MLGQGVSPGKPPPPNSKSPSGAKESWCHMPNTYTSLIYHIVFGTKHQARLITAEIAPHLYAYMGGIISHLDGRYLL